MNTGLIAAGPAYSESYVMRPLLDT